MNSTPKSQDMLKNETARPPTYANAERIANLRPIYDEHRTLCLQIRDLNEQIHYRWGAPRENIPPEIALEIALEIAALKTQLNINSQLQLKLQEEDAEATINEEKEEAEFQAAIARQTEIENTLVVSTASPAV